MKQKQNALAVAFQQLLVEAERNDLSIKIILQILAEKGLACVLILFSLPFCIPIPLPGVSTPFGIALIFLGFQLAFSHEIKLPKKISKIMLTYQTLEKIAHVAIKLTNSMQFLISTRMVWLVQNPKLQLLHGITIAFLGTLLALPLPIPFTNFFSALPIVIFGLGFLEDDGLTIIVAYIMTFICILFFGFLFWSGFHLFTAFL